MQNAPAKNKTQHVVLLLWLKTILFSIFLFGIFLLYICYELGSFSLLSIDKSIAAVAFILIGLSLALSTVSHFFPVFEPIFKYRKYFGLCGYFVLLIHLFVLLVLLGNVYPFPSYYLESDHFFSFIFIAIPAISIYTLMALISNNYATKKLGGKVWRNLLRLGFFAYFLSLTYLSLTSWTDWEKWFEMGKGSMVPSSMLIVYYGSLILLGRVVLHIANLRNPKKPV